MKDCYHIDAFDKLLVDQTMTCLSAAPSDEIGSKRGNFVNWVRRKLAFRDLTGALNEVLNIVICLL